MISLKISHDRYFQLQYGIEQENLLWMADRETGDVTLFFTNVGEELLFLLKWSTTLMEFV